MPKQLQFVKEYKLHQAAIYCLEQGLQPHLFYSAGSDRKVIEWNVETDEHKVVAQIPSMIVALCLLPKANLLLVGQSVGGIHILDLADKKELKLLALHNGYIFDIQFNELLNQIYVASGDGSFSVWDATTFELIHHQKLTEKKIRQLAFSNSRNELAVGCGDGKLHLINLKNFETKNILEHTSSVNSLLYVNNDSQLLVGEKEAYLNLWDLMIYNKIKSIPAHNWAIYSIKAHKDEACFYTASRDKTIKVWALENLEPIQRIQIPKMPGHTHSVNALLPIDFKNYLISAGDDRKIKVWQLVS